MSQQLQLPPLGMKFQVFERKGDIIIDWIVISPVMEDTLGGLFVLCDMVRRRGVSGGLRRRAIYPLSIMASDIYFTRLKSVKRGYVAMPP